MELEKWKQVCKNAICSSKKETTGKLGAKKTKESKKLNWKTTNAKKTKETLRRWQECLLHTSLLAASDPQWIGILGIFQELCEHTWVLFFRLSSSMRLLMSLFWLRITTTFNLYHCAFHCLPIMIVVSKTNPRVQLLPLVPCVCLLTVICVLLLVTLFLVSFYYVRVCGGMAKGNTFGSGSWFVAVKV